MEYQIIKEALKNTTKSFDVDILIDCIKFILNYNIEEDIKDNAIKLLIHKYNTKELKIFKKQIS